MNEGIVDAVALAIYRDAGMRGKPRWRRPCGFVGGVRFGHETEEGDDAAPAGPGHRRRKRGSGRREPSGPPRMGGSRSLGRPSRPKKEEEGGRSGWAKEKKNRPNRPDGFLGPERDFPFSFFYFSRLFNPFSNRF